MWVGREIYTQSDTEEHEGKDGVSINGRIVLKLFLNDRMWRYGLDKNHSQ
jgi:hypothetical protein